MDGNPLNVVFWRSYGDNEEESIGEWTHRDAHPVHI